MMVLGSNSRTVRAVIRRTAKEARIHSSPTTMNALQAEGEREGERERGREGEREGGGKVEGSMSMNKLTVVFAKREHKHSPLTSCSLNL